MKYTYTQLRDALAEAYEIWLDDRSEENYEAAAVLADEIMDKSGWTWLEYLTHPKS